MDGNVYYIVLEKSFKHIYCCEIIEGDAEYDGYVYTNFNGKKYGLTEKVHVMACSIYTIQISDIILRKSSLDIDDKRMLEKALQISNNRYSLPKKLSLGVSVEILPGDIISMENEEYLVYGVSDELIELFKLYPSCGYKMCNMAQLYIESEDRYFYFYYCSTEFNRKKIKYTLWNRISKNQIENVNEYLNYYKEHFEFKGFRNVNHIGTIYNVCGENFLYLFTLGKLSYGLNVNFIDNFNYKIDIDEIAQSKKLKCINKIEDYDFSWYKFDKEIINILYELKVKPFEPIEDLYKKFNSWSDN